MTERLSETEYMERAEVHAAAGEARWLADVADALLRDALVRDARQVVLLPGGALALSQLASLVTAIAEKVASVEELSGPTAAGAGSARG